MNIEWTNEHEQQLSYAQNKYYNVEYEVYDSTRNYVELLELKIAALEEQKKVCFPTTMYVVMSEYSNEGIQGISDLFFVKKEADDKCAEYEKNKNSKYISYYVDTINIDSKSLQTYFSNLLNL